MNWGRTLRLPGHRPTGVIVTGPFRSGTSLVSGILADLGVFFGPLSETSPPPDRYNPLGYFQRREIVAANSRYIASAGGTLANPGTPEALLSNGDWKILANTSTSWRADTQLWGLKDPRFSATLLSWLSVGRFDSADLKVVRVRRNTSAAAASVMKHKEVREYCDSDFRKALAMTETYDENAALLAARIGTPVCLISYESLIADPRQEVERVASYLGLGSTCRISHASRLVGKRRALFAHYVRKAAAPALLADTIAKTVRAKLLALG